MSVRQNHDRLEEETLLDWSRPKCSIKSCVYGGCADLFRFKTFKKCPHIAGTVYVRTGRKVSGLHRNDRMSSPQDSCHADCKRNFAGKQAKRRHKQSDSRMTLHRDAQSMGIVSNHPP